MIGTVTASENEDFDHNNSETCYKVLKRIKEHPTKAARSYYYPTILNYFNKMNDWLASSYRALTDKGKIICVVQTSFFKEIEMPIGDIFVEMANSIGYDKSDFIRRDNIKFHRGRMDPDQRKYSSDRTLHEDVILFRK